MRGCIVLSRVPAVPPSATLQVGFLRTPVSLIGAGTGILDHFGPLDDLRLDISRKLLWRIANRFGSQLEEALSHVWHVENLDDFGVKLIDNVFGCFGRSRDAYP